MYNYICFDLDGTLTMSEFGVTRAVEYALNKMGIEEPDKKKLALLLKNKYHSSNKQLARLTGLPLKEVDAMFPLAGTAQNR